MVIRILFGVREYIGVKNAHLRALKSAKNGYLTTSLNMLLGRGAGVEASVFEAYKFEMASGIYMQDNQRAFNFVKEGRKQRLNKLSKKLTKEEIKHATIQAREWAENHPVWAFGHPFDV